jgi:hypothetical protein
VQRCAIVLPCHSCSLHLRVFFWASIPSCWFNTGLLLVFHWHCAAARVTLTPQTRVKS